MAFTLQNESKRKRRKDSINAMVDFNFDEDDSNGSHEHGSIDADAVGSMGSEGVGGIGTPQSHNGHASTRRFFLGASMSSMFMLTALALAGKAPVSAPDVSRLSSYIRRRLVQLTENPEAFHTESAARILAASAEFQYLTYGVFSALLVNSFLETRDWRQALYAGDSFGCRPVSCYVILDLLRSVCVWICGCVGACMCAYRKRSYRRIMAWHHLTIPLRFKLIMASSFFPTIVLGWTAKCLIDFMYAPAPESVGGSFVAQDGKQAETQVLQQLLRSLLLEEAHLQVILIVWALEKSAEVILEVVHLILSCQRERSRGIFKYEFHDCSLNMDEPKNELDIHRCFAECNEDTAAAVTMILPCTGEEASDRELAGHYGEDCSGESWSGTWREPIRCPAKDLVAGKAFPSHELRDVSDLAADKMELAESAYWLLAVCLLYAFFVEHST